MAEKCASESKDNDSESDCSICLQPCLQPVKLPCDHIFCFLCVKGLIHQNNTCALCREEIPRNYLINPQFVQQAARDPDTSYRWFYQGQSGWWQYDDRTNSEIETAYQNRQQECDVLIAGLLYVIDFSRNLQMQKYNPRCLRHIKRDLVTAPKKGVAGVHMGCGAFSSFDNSNASCSKSDDLPSKSNASCSKSTDSSSKNNESCSKNDDFSSKSNASCSKSTDSSSKNNESCTSTASSELKRNLVILLSNIGLPGVNLNLGNETVSVSTNSKASSCDSSCQTDDTELIGIQSTSTDEKNCSSDNEFLPVSAGSSKRKSRRITNKENLAINLGLPQSKGRKRRKGTNIVEPTEPDMYKSFAATVMSKLQEMNKDQRLFSEKLINDTLFNGILGKLSEKSCII